MKILLISDIHSNKQALDAVLASESGFDLLVCAGDLVDYGTNPSYVVDYFRNRTEPTVLVHGNHDTHLVECYNTNEYLQVSGKSYKWIHHNCERLDRSRVNYIASLPTHLVFSADGWDYLIQHQYDQSYGVIESRYQFDSYWNEYAHTKADRRRMIFGHSHRQCRYILWDGMEWLNPGSISYRRPDDPDKSANYMVINDGNVEFKSLCYDRSVQLAEAEAFKKSGQMMDTEIQDFMFFFGNARTSRDPL